MSPAARPPPPQLLLVLGCSLLLMLADSAAGASGGEDVLITTLLQGYAKDARPPPSNQPTDVHIGMYLSSLDDVEEHLLTITISGCIIATWTDSRLAWNTTAWNQLDRIVVAADTIWKPDFALTDAVGDVFDKGFYSDYYGIFAEPGGNLSWTLEGSMTVRCDFNLTYYPFDVQTCSFRYESFNYPSYLLHLYTDTTTVDLSSYHENSEFYMLSTAAIAEEWAPEIDGNYSNVVFTLKIKRRELYFWLNLILPCILLAVLSCFVFLLPAASGERVGLAITLLLAFSVFQLLVAGYLPMNSLTSTILTNFILIATFFNGLAIILTIFVLRVAEKEDEPVPRWLETLFFRKLGVLFGITHRKRVLPLQTHDAMSEHLPLNVKSVDSTQDGVDLNEITAKNENLRYLLSSVRKIEEILKTQDHHRKHAEKWNAVAKVFDIIIFILFSLAIFWLCISCLVLLPAKSS